MPKQRMTQAVNDGIAEEMRRDPSVILFGEDVEISPIGDTRGLADEFGRDRVRNTPISESAMTGMAVGAAAAGARVICHMFYGNFIYTGFDAVANQAAKLRYMLGGQITLPITFLAMIGGGRSVAAQHSDSMHPMLMNLGGLKVVLPASPADGKGLIKAAIRDDNPVFFLQAAGRGGESGDVPEGDWIIPIGEGVVRRPGKDLTIVALGSMLKPALKAAQTLEGQGVSAEVIDPRTAFPMDYDLIEASVRRTGRLVVVDEARLTCSAASEVAATISERCFSALKGPVRRVAVKDVAMPYSPVLEKAVMPDAANIVAAAQRALEPAGA